jgi:hypothetical protein
MNKIKIFTTSDFYGAKSLFSECGFTSVSWVHGWKFIEPINQVSMIDPVESLVDYHLVWTDKQKQFLIENGITAVEAVGSPFLYILLYDHLFPHPKLPTCDILAIPPHSIRKGYKRQGIEPYFSYLVNRYKGKRIQVSLTSVDIDNLDILALCKKYGLIPICGASIDRADTFPYLRELYKSSKVIDTSTIGSHVVFAIACGCKVNISEEFYIDYEISEYIDHPYFSNKDFRQHLENRLERSKLSNLKKHFPHLFIDSEGNQEWALNELGVESIKDIEFVKGIFKRHSSKRKYIKFIIKKVIVRLFMKLRTYLT